MTLNAREAADFLKVNYQTLLQMVKRGDVPAAKLGRSYVFIREDLVETIRGRYADSRCAAQVLN